MKIYSALLTLCLTFLFPQDCDAVIGLIACPTLTGYLNDYLMDDFACYQCTSAWSWTRGPGVRAICQTRTCGSDALDPSACKVDKIDMEIYLFGAQTAVCLTEEPVGPGGPENGPSCSNFEFGKEALTVFANAYDCKSTFEGAPCKSCTLVDDALFPLPLPGTYVSGCTQLED
jgi:hypothetical protein